MRWIVARKLFFSAILMCAAGPALSAESQTSFSTAVTAAKASMVIEPQTALRHAEEALAAAEILPPGRSHDTSLAQALALLGEARTRIREPQQAVPVLKSALSYVTRAAPGTALQAEILESLGGASSEMGRDQEALGYLQQSYQLYATLKDGRGQSKNLVEIGSIYSDAKDYERALSYYDKAIDAKSNDPMIALVAQNNKAFALKNKGDLAGAEEAFRRAARAADGLHSGYLKTSILGSLAYVEASEGKLSEAKAHLKEAQLLAQQDPDSRSEAPFLWGGEAKIAAREGDLNRAAILLDKAFAGLDLNQTTTEFLDFHGLASEVYGRTNAFNKAFVHLRAFKRLEDQSNTMAASIGAQIAAARFDLETERARTAEVRSAKARSEIQSTLLILTLLAGFSLAAAAFIYVNHERIRKKNVALAAALRTKTEFLSNINHELRTPLNGIVAPIDMLSRTPLDAQQRVLTDTIRHSADSLQMILQAILDVTDLSSGEMTMRMEIFSPRDAIRVATDDHRLGALSKGVDLTVKLEDDLGLVKGDERRLSQAIGCVLSNAVKFTEHGSITVAGAVRDGALVLTVTDTGVGFDPSQAEHLFEAFNQADNSLTRIHGGAGIGLSLARALVRAMGGELIAEGAPGQGACFTFTLPVSQGIGTDQAPATTDAVRASVLLAEDNAANRQVVELILSAAGVSVTSVENGAEAVDAFRLGTFDLVIMDLQMPVMDGFEAIQAIRLLEDASGHETPILVLSANAHTEHVAAAKAAGGDLFLSKPISADGLLRAVEQLLDGGRPKRQSMVA